MDDLLQDLRYAVRTLTKSPGFTIIAVSCLALGIATNTTMFSVFNGALLRPPPYRAPEELIVVERAHDVQDVLSNVSYQDMMDWREQSRLLADVAGNTGRSLAITEGEEPERIRADLVTWNLFPMLGVAPQLGRLIREDEDLPGAQGVALLSDALWKRRYAGDSTVLGRTISIDNRPYTVIGIMPVKFKFPEESEIWLPVRPVVHTSARATYEMNVIARLKPGTTIQLADRELRDLSQRTNEAYGLDNAWHARAKTLAAQMIPDDVRTVVTAMMGAVMFVLLIATANVANLMLTRAAGRSREIAIRAAIGAGRWRIIRQLLVESVMIALLAGIIAVPLTKFGVHLIESAMPAEDPLPYYIQFTVDATVMLYTAGVSLLAGVLFGLAPALQISRGHVYEALKEGGRSGSTGIGRNRLRNVLVIGEVALSLVLLIGASLFMRSFFALQHAQIGYDPTPILTMRTFFPGTRYDSTTAKSQRVEDLIARIEALPGVEAAAISNLIPMDGGGAGGSVAIDGSKIEPGKEPNIFWTGVGGHWFETVAVRPYEGRTFTEAEVRDSQPVAVINRRMATQLWAGRHALGGRFRFTSDSSRTWYTVIGIVDDVRNTRLDENRPEDMTAYLPYKYLPVRNHGILVRASQDPLALVKPVRDAIRASDPTLPVWSVRTLEKVRELTFWQYGLFGAMFGAFGIVALFLAAVGVYGVISFGVSQRTRDFGVRMALGASSGHVVRMVVREGVVLAGIGIAIGLVGAFGVTRGVASILIGVSATDPLSFLGVSAFLIGIAALASLIPARRATGVDPIVALRSD